MDKFYYSKDFFDMEHYYKINSDGTCIHVNKTSLLINDYSKLYGGNEDFSSEFGSVEEITEEIFETALIETLTKLGLKLSIKPFKF